MLTKRHHTSWLSSSLTCKS